MEERRILDSWKEISGYLNRSVMTCHRWEENLGLPIHRLDGTPKARVFAYADELDRWLAKKLHTAEVAEESARPAARPRRKWAWIAVASVATLAVLAAAAWRYFYFKPVPAPAQVPSLAVLPFENRTGDPVWDAWKMAAPDLIMTDLRQSKFLDVIKMSSLYQAAGDLAEAERFSTEDLKKIAEKAGVDYALTGSLIKSGDDIVIAALIRDARRGDVVASPRSTFRTEKGIFSGVDKLSKEVRIGLNIKPRVIRGDIDKPVARITTSSPEAFRLFSQAYRIQGKLKFDEAISPMLKAVELDPKFGLAYRLLFHCCRAVSRKEETKKYGGMAVRLAERIEERERELFLYDFYDSEQFDKKKSIQALERLGKNYPYDMTMLGLSGFYESQEEYEKAIPILERLHLRYKLRLSVIQSLSRCYQSAGLYDKAEKLLDDYVMASPKPGMDMMFVLERRLRLALVQSKFDVAHECADRLTTAFPNLSLGLSWKGFIYFMQNDFANAEKMYQRLVGNDNKKTQRSGLQYLSAVSLARGRIDEAKQRILRAVEVDKSAGQPYMEGEYHYFLAYLERVSGRLPEALKEADLACRGAEGPGLRFVRKLYLRALITLEMDRSEEFEKQAEEIKRYLDPDRSPEGAPRFMRVYLNLLGHRELQKGNYDLAISYYWKALDLLSVLGAQSHDDDHATYFHDLAEAYRRSGKLSAAIPMYEKVLSPTVGREVSGDLYAKSHYWMGLDWEERIRNLGTPAEARERRLKAIGYYRKFLELWKDADPIFPEVEDAKNRLARLETEQGRADGLPRKN